MKPMFDRMVMDDALQYVAEEFGESAPVVADWCDRIHAAPDSEVTLADLSLLWYLHTERVPPSAATNSVLHRMKYAGQNTEGLLDF